jgi:hypothetical protein
MFDNHLSLSYPVFPFAMKQTPEDLRFAGDFAEALRPHVDGERKRGHALKVIAGWLGVTEPALKKYLGGRTTWQETERPFAAIVPSFRDSDSKLRRQACAEAASHGRSTISAASYSSSSEVIVHADTSSG